MVFVHFYGLAESQYFFDASTERVKEQGGKAFYFLEQAYPNQQALQIEVEIKLYLVCRCHIVSTAANHILALQTYRNE